MTLFGFNDTNWNYELIKDRAFKNPGGIYVVFTPTQAAELLWLTDFKATTIVRFWPDDNAHMATSGIDWINYANYEMQQQLGDQYHEMKKHIFIQYANEPSGQLEKLAAETLSAMNHARSLGLRMAVLTFGHGHPQPSDWPLFRDIFADLQDHYHILNLHEYYDIDTEKDHGVKFEDDFWQMGRYYFLLDYLDGEDLTWPLVAFAEWEFDSTAHSDIKGYLAVMNNRGWTMEQITGFITKAMKKYTRLANSGNLLGFCWFSAGSGGNWLNFDAYQRSDLVEFLNNVRIPITEGPPMNSDVLYFKNAMNLRDGPGTNFDVIDQVPARETFPSDWAFINDDGTYIWIFIQSEYYEGHVAAGTSADPDKYVEIIDSNEDLLNQIHNAVNNIKIELQKITNATNEL